MVNYQNGRIYRLVSGSGKQYIGSTTQLLCRRMADHLMHYKGWKNGKKNFITSFNLFEEGGKVEIILIENYPCENNEELHQRERYWIETMDCVNKQIPTRKPKEYYETNKEQISEQKKQHYEANREQKLEYRKQYYETNKEQISEYQKQYHQTNREQISERQKQYYENNREQILEQQKQYYEANKERLSEKNNQKIQCECGAEISRVYLSRHQKTKKHTEAMKHCSTP